MTNPFLDHLGPVLPWRERPLACKLGWHRFDWARPGTLIANHRRCVRCGVEDGGNDA